MDIGTNYTKATVDDEKVTFFSSMIVYGNEKYWTSQEGNEDYNLPKSLFKQADSQILKDFLEETKQKSKGKEKREKKKEEIKIEE